MIKIFLLIIIFVLSGSLCAEPILDLINNGKIHDARDKIGQLSTATVRNGNLLFFQGLIETEGETSKQFLEAAVKAGLSPEYLERNTYLTVQYFLAEGHHEKAIATAQAYMQRWENGKYRAQILRLAAYTYKHENQEQNSDRFLNNLIKENDKKLFGVLGEIDQAYYMYDQKKYIAAQNICRRLTNSGHDAAAASAMYMLSKYSIVQKRIDDAILYYNLLKERYGNAIGLDDLVGKFAGLDNSLAGGKAEEIAGAYYSIQVGVFSDKNNARKLAKDMKKYGEKVDLKNKSISGKKYYVVYIGRFANTGDALSFKTRLEAAENEAFQIVAR